MKNKTSFGLVALGLLAAIAAAPMLEGTAHAAGKVKARIDGKGFSSTSQATTAVAVSSPVPLLMITATKVNIRKRTTATMMMSINVDLASLTLPATVTAFSTTYGYGGIGGVQETYFGNDSITVTLKKFKKNKLIGTFEGSLQAGATGSGGGPVAVERGKIKVKVLTTP